MTRAYTPSATVNRQTDIEVSASSVATIATVRGAPRKTRWP